MRALIANKVLKNKIEQEINDSLDQVNKLIEYGELETEEEIEDYKNDLIGSIEIGVKIWNNPINDNEEIHYQRIQVILNTDSDEYCYDITKPEQQLEKNKINPELLKKAKNLAKFLYNNLEGDFQVNRCIEGNVNLFSETPKHFSINFESNILYIRELETDTISFYEIN